MHGTIAVPHACMCVRAERAVPPGEKRTYDNQYAQLYFCRLLAMVPRLRARVEASWPGIPGGGQHPSTHAKPGCNSTLHHRGSRTAQ